MTRGIVNFSTDPLDPHLGLHEPQTGDAVYYGAEIGTKLSAPIVGMA